MRSLRQASYSHALTVERSDLSVRFSRIQAMTSSARLEFQTRCELEGTRAARSEESASDTYRGEEVGLNGRAGLIGADGDVAAGEIRGIRSANIYLVGEVESLSNQVKRSVLSQRKLLEQSQIE